MHSVMYSPCVGARLEEERDVAGRGVQGRHADNESYETTEDGTGDMPELRNDYKLAALFHI